ncbi:hypothetical protein Nepgr_022419 [Nepenthes gracilis]|uniref:non-specific serine/threonine protein kinase n=1 Tax=Nepenthes gracilis TaxID=150966 RepID=A0AAD3XWY7_NEPGR|nr:hypothetical protein Nepgr_022419 [Nepenthes gracilis]
MGSYLVTAARMSICGLIFSLMHVSIVLASGVVVQATICSDERFSFLESPGHGLFYINRHKVDKEFFCHALRLHYANCCHLRNNFGNNICELDLSTVKLAIVPGRKLLVNRVKGGTISPPTVPHESKNDHQFTFTSKIMGIALPGVVIFGCVFMCPCFYSKRKKTEEIALPRDPTSMDSISSFEMSANIEKVPGTPLRHAPPSPRISSSSPTDLYRQRSIHLNYSDIVKATHNFSESLVIGEGGFGTVYKARLRDGQEVAIKRAKKEHFDSAEFDSEVRILSKIDHRNLVKLLAYVDRGNERIIITEYVPNGTLRQHLDGEYESILDFNQRLEIAIDVSHGLTHLHLYSEKQIIHRDIKSSNILLTERLRAKVADFGFARAGPADDDQTHISTKVKGTVGYLDPEYMRTYQLTPKSDVYSFGILLLEILTGRRPVEVKRDIEERVLLRWASYNYSKGNITRLLDPQLEEAIDAKTLEKLFWLAIQCAAPVRADRPEMREVGERLWTIRMEYQRQTRIA